MGIRQLALPSVHAFGAVKMEISVPTWLAPEVVLFGFVFALPFIGIKQYAARISLSAIAALLAYWGLVALAQSHGWAYWDNYNAVCVILGALCAAHVRTLWLLVGSRLGS
jgi:hypothetical protein